VTVTRRNKEGEKLVVAATPTVVEYNKRMGGVDLNDKMAKVDKSRKAYKWYARIDRKCNMWALFNAYVLYSRNPLVLKPMEFRSFALRVQTTLIGKEPARKAALQTLPISPEVRFSREALHCPTVPGGSDKRCVVCEKKHKLEKARDPRKANRVFTHKSVKTTFQCSTCMAFLCIKRGTACWADYHTKDRFWL
jgi:hypothetical protein